MSRKPTSSETRRWHVDSWPPLAWLETVIKLIAIFLGMLALIQALAGDTFVLARGLRLTQFIVLAFLSVGLVASLNHTVRNEE